MTFFQILVEGASDAPTMREIMTRKFNLKEGVHFKIHPHRGRGNLPKDIEAPPDPRQRTLLHQLPATLRAYSHCGEDICVLVVVDADDTPCQELLKSLNEMLNKLSRKPSKVLLRLAIEETESWFIADHDAVKRAFPKVDSKKLAAIQPDSIVGAWEKLAEALEMKKASVTGADKYAWAEKIAPHLNLDDAPSPSLNKLISRVHEHLTAG